MFCVGLTLGASSLVFVSAAELSYSVHFEEMAIIIRKQNMT